MLSTVDMINTFSFEPITADDILQQIKCLDISKAAQESDVPTKLVERLDYLIVNYLLQNFNNCLEKGTFANDFKNAVVHAIHKKDCKTEMVNYRSISVLPNLSKIQEQLLYDQMYTYFSIFFVKYQCDLLKGYSTQHCFLVMTEKNEGSPR